MYNTSKFDFNFFNLLKIIVKAEKNCEIARLRMKKLKIQRFIKIYNEIFQVLV